MHNVHKQRNVHKVMVLVKVSYEGILVHNVHKQRNVHKVIVLVE